MVECGDLMWLSLDVSVLEVFGRDRVSRDGSFCIFFLQAEDGIRDLVRSRGLGDVYKRQMWVSSCGLWILRGDRPQETVRQAGAEKNRDDVPLLSLIHI